MRDQTVPGTTKINHGRNYSHLINQNIKANHYLKTPRIHLQYSKSVSHAWSVDGTTCRLVIFLYHPSSPPFMAYHPSSPPFEAIAHRVPGLATVRHVVVDSLSIVDPKGWRRCSPQEEDYNVENAGKHEARSETKKCKKTRGEKQKVGSFNFILQIV